MFTAADFIVVIRSYRASTDIVTTPGACYVYFPLCAWILCITLRDSCLLMKLYLVTLFCFSSFFRLYFQHFCVKVLYQFNTSCWMMHEKLMPENNIWLEIDRNSYSLPQVECEMLYFILWSPVAFQYMSELLNCDLVASMPTFHINYSSLFTN